MELHNTMISLSRLHTYTRGIYTLHTRTECTFYFNKIQRAYGHRYSAFEFIIAAHRSRKQKLNKLRYIVLGFFSFSFCGARYGGTVNFITFRSQNIGPFKFDVDSPSLSASTRNWIYIYVIIIKFCVCILHAYFKRDDRRCQRCRRRLRNDKAIDYFCFTFTFVLFLFLRAVVNLTFHIFFIAHIKHFHCM